MKKIFAAPWLFAGATSAYAGTSPPMSMRMVLGIDPSPLCATRLGRAPGCQTIGSVPSSGRFQPYAYAGTAAPLVGDEESDTSALGIPQPIVEKGVKASPHRLSPSRPGSALTNIAEANVQFTQTGAKAAIDLAANAKESFNLRQFDPLACTSPSHDDAAALRAAITAMGTSPSGGASIKLPHATCYFGSLSSVTTYGRVAVIVPNGVFVTGEGAQGTPVLPAVSMDDMVAVTGHLAGVFDVQFANRSSLATSAIQINKPFDGTPVYVYRNYFSGFTGSTTGGVHVEGGDWQEIEKNTFISNAMAVSFNNGGGVNAIVRDNYVAGGSGFLFTNNANRPQGVEGGIVENNTVFAANGIAIDAPQTLNLRLLGNTFESSNVTARFAALPVSQAHPNGTSTNDIISTGNWYGNGAAAGMKGAAALQLRGTRGFVSIGDTFAGRGNVAVDGLATAGNPNQNAVFIGPSFYAPDVAAQASIDMSLSYMYGISIQSPIFSGVVDIDDGGGVVGRVDGGEFNAVPMRVSPTFAYGRQAFGLNLLASGQGTIAAGTNAVPLTHGLSYVPQRQDVTIKPINAVGATAGFYVDGCDATTCKVRVPEAPTGSAAAFAYTIDETR